MHGHSMVLQTAMPMILGYFVYDLALAAFVSGSAMEKLMVVHHSLCIMVWPISFHYRTGCFLHPLHDGGRAKHTILVVGGVFLAQIQNYGACVYFVGPCYGLGLFCDSYTSRTSSIEFFDLVSNLLEGREPCHLLVGHDHTAITKSFVHLLVCQDSPRHGWCACQRQEGLRWIVGASIYDRFIAWRIDCLMN